ncbi:MAG: hypothetical protein GWO24_30230, partial [Akkermansiaceae bacterium]|nr:hypothetical protein [Akkermansiaceae bacterium]
DAIGAVVTLNAGSETHTRVLRAGDGFLSQSSKRLHFGLAGLSGDASPAFTVRWPDGSTEQFS